MIENAEDRKDAESKTNDTLLVKYFSLHYMNQVRKLMASMLDYCHKADYPLLLIYGAQDLIVDKSGCDRIYTNWLHKDKAYHVVENGAHGKSTVLAARETIHSWIKRVQETKAR